MSQADDPNRATVINPGDRWDQSQLARELLLEFSLPSCPMCNPDEAYPLYLEDILHALDSAGLALTKVPNPSTRMDLLPIGASRHTEESDMPYEERRAGPGARVIPLRPNRGDTSG